jgi:plastocyanin
MAALRLAPVALLVIALALAGCTGGGKGGASTSPTSSGGGVSVGVSASGSGSASHSASGSASASSTGAPPLSGSVAKDITDNAFPDGTFAVKVGSTVTWTDKGTNPHSVSADDKSFDSSPNCPPACLSAVPGANTFSHKFDTAGSVSYHCKIHASMTGTITVVA